MILAPPILPFPFVFSFGSVTPYKDDPKQTKFEEDLALFIVKELVSLSCVEALFLGGYS
jgi:hypothetical protein